MRLILPALISVLVFGCANTRVPRLEPRNDIVLTNGVTIPVYGVEKDSKAFFSIFNAISKMPEKVQKSITFFVVYPGPTKCDLNRNGAAHCHSHSRKICINGKYTDGFLYLMRVVWHESFHAYFADLPISAMNEWKAIAGKVYDKNKRYADGPSEGCVTDYAHTDYDEDVAEFAAAVFGYVYIYKPYGFEVYNDFIGVNKSDSRYYRKLKFLLDWGFISRAEYDAVEFLVK